MLNQKVLEYIDDVMSRIAAPEEVKVKLEKELIKHFIEVSENIDIDEIINKMGSSERLANEVSLKLVNGMSKQLNGIFMEADKQNVKPTEISKRNSGEYASMRKHGGSRAKRYHGEYTRQESDVNIKLLYIPLIQISSGVQTLHYFLTDDDECYNN